jgi:hypothetical protein
VGACHSFGCCLVPKGNQIYDAEERVVSVVGLDVADGVVQAIRAVVNPDKLGHLGAVSEVARRPEKH